MWHLSLYWWDRWMLSITHAMILNSIFHSTINIGVSNPFPVVKNINNDTWNTSRLKCYIGINLCACRSLLLFIQKSNCIFQYRVSHVMLGWQLGLSGMRDRFGIFGAVITNRKLSLLLVMTLRMPNNKSKVHLDRSFILLLLSTSTTQDCLDTSLVESFTLIRIRTQK